MCVFLQAIIIYRIIITIFAFFCVSASFLAFNPSPPLTPSPAGVLSQSPDASGPFQGEGPGGSQCACSKRINAFINSDNEPFVYAPSSVTLRGRGRDLFFIFHFNYDQMESGVGAD